MVDSRITMSMEVEDIRQLVAHVATRLNSDGPPPKLYYTLLDVLDELEVESEQNRKIIHPRFEVMSKARKYAESKPTGFFAEIGELDGKRYIHLTGIYCNKDVDITFFEGETAEYDSYNLSYLGKITKITEKCVTIDPRYGESTKRLDLNSFAWRNYNFDLDAVNKANHETSMYI